MQDIMVDLYNLFIDKSKNIFYNATIFQLQKEENEYFRESN